MPNVHPSALISSDVELAEDVSVGPFSVIEGPVKIAAGTKIGGHVHITGRVEIAENCRIDWGAIVGAMPQDLGFDPETDAGVRIGEGTQLREYVTIHRATKPGGWTTLGKGNFLMTGAHLGHDVVMGDHNILANNVLLGGHVHLGSRAFLGGGAALHQFLNVGDYAMLRGNSGFSQDLPPYCMGYGDNVLAGLNIVGLRRGGFDSATRAEIKRVYHLLFMSGKLMRHALEEAAQLEWSPAAQKLIDAVAHPSRKGVVRPASRHRHEAD
jgi:UDP-N-acetylglucosamine acyltransferase